MSDAAVFDDELRSLEEHVQSCLRAMDTTSGDARQDKYNRAQELLKSAQRTFHHLKVEIRQLEPVEAADYERRCKEHNTLITQLKEQLAAKNLIPTTQNDTLAVLTRIEQMVEETKRMGDSVTQCLAEY